MATEIQFDLKGDTYTAKIKAGKWSNYHVTKHLLIDYNNDGYDRLHGFGNRVISAIRDIQKLSFDCQVTNNSTIENTCKGCDFHIECDETISKIKEKYISGIKESLTNDCKDPRHATFKKKNNYGKTGMVTIDNYMVIIDNYGRMVIATIVKEKEKFVNVLTSFRKTIKKTQNKIDFRFDRLKFENRLYVSTAIRHWQYRFASEDYKDVNKYLIRNWT